MGNEGTEDEAGDKTSRFGFRMGCRWEVTCAVRVRVKANLVVIIPNNYGVLVGCQALC